MKKSLLVLIAILVAIGILPACSTASQEKITLKWAAPQPSTWTPAKGWQKWADSIAQRTNGRITVEFFWGGALAKPGEEIATLRNGVADLTMFNVIYYPSECQLGGVSYATAFGPQGSISLLDLTNRLWKEIPEMSKEIEGFNVQPLFHNALPSYQITSTKPIKNLADLKGKKIAVMASYAELFKAVGAVPVIQSANERYSSLQTGVIDAQSMDIATTESFKLAEVAKYATIVDLGATYVGDCVMSKSSWNKLSPADQKILLEEGVKAAEFITTTFEADLKAAMDKWKAQGITFDTFSSADKAAWAVAAKNVPATWAKDRDAKGLPGTKTMDAYYKIASDLGYPFPAPWK